MGRYLDPTGEPTFGIALCARCSRKFPLSHLFSDPNSPGLMVCRDDLDDYDPYRLAPRPEDVIALAFVRPDTNIDTNPVGFVSEDGNYFFITEDGNYYIVLDNAPNLIQSVLDGTWLLDGDRILDGNV